MTAEERIAELEMELARERAENASLRKPMEQVLACLREVAAEAECRQESLR